jgi:hypothetical protein
MKEFRVVYDVQDIYSVCKYRRHDIVMAPNKTEAGNLIKGRAGVTIVRVVQL